MIALFAFVICTQAGAAVHPASPAPARDAVPLFAFRSGFWINLHHFLYVLGRARAGTPDSHREAVVHAPEDVEGLAAQPDASRAAWDAAVTFYQNGPSKQDLVFDADLIKTTAALASVPDDSDLSGLSLDPGLVSTLQRAAPVYRAVWWARHSRANAARTAELRTLVDRYGAAAVKRLTEVYRASWPSRPRTINIVAYANWAGAYSTDGGLIVFESTDPDIGGTQGLEILLHESSHQWDEEMAGRLKQAAAQAGKPLPPTLSHSLVFYTSGEVVREIVPGHEPYAIKNGIWDRGGMRGMKPLLDRYWLPYIKGQGTFEDAAAAIIQAIDRAPQS